MLPFILVTCAVAAMPLANGDHEGYPVSLSSTALPPNMTQNNVEAKPSTHDGKPALEVRFHKVDWPNVFFTPTDGMWDWSAWAGLEIEIHNPERSSVTVCVRVDDARPNGAINWNTATFTARPGLTKPRLHFNTGRPSHFWGMRGTPDTYEGFQGSPADLSKVVAFQVFLPRPDREHTLTLRNIRLFKSSDDQLALPFVDKFGQYKHADWPGKLKSGRQLLERMKAEERSIEAAPALSGRDRYGGWSEGPKLEATGWFRTQKVDGRWWLVTPDGHLFFSLGVDTMHTWEQTFIEKRRPWFEWLPEKSGEFKPAFGYFEGAHSMAETIGGKGETFSFYRANLIRKYGDRWQERWRQVSYARLRAWGFNTIGNWSDGDLLKHSPLPFVTSATVTGDFRRIEGGGGYWNKMPDVYDPKFAEAADLSISRSVKQFADNPLCIGYFVDNEIAWDAVERGPLASPADQPCRVEMVRRLTSQYGSLEAVNKSWSTTASTWDDLRVPDQPNEACRRDLDAWVYAFARRYFDTVQAAVRRHAPKQLYLGCRFAWSHPQAIRACADVADVVSFNIYSRGINCADWTGEKDLGKPIIIGEFHFGALDRGMFHTGLVPTSSQQERAESFKHYVRSVADCACFVGCHWFQYVDEPLTGRVYDGENYNIGLVDITDTPYPELTSAAREVNAEVYARHARSR